MKRRLITAIIASAFACSRAPIQTVEEDPLVAGPTAVCKIEQPGDRIILDPLVTLTVVGLAESWVAERCADDESPQPRDVTCAFETDPTMIRATIAGRLVSNEFNAERWSEIIADYPCEVLDAQDAVVGTYVGQKTSPPTDTMLADLACIASCEGMGNVLSQSKVIDPPSVKGDGRVPPGFCAQVQQFTAGNDCALGDLSWSASLGVISKGVEWNKDGDVVEEDWTNEYSPGAYPKYPTAVKTKCRVKAQYWTRPLDLTPTCRTQYSALDAEAACRAKAGGKVAANLELKGKLVCVKNEPGNVADPCELVANGEFSGGTDGFTSDYRLETSSIYDAATYAVATDPQQVHGAAFSYIAAEGHSAEMMVVNGATWGSELDRPRVWSEVLDVTPYTSYNFSFLISSWYEVAPAHLAVFADGAHVLTVEAPAQGGIWDHAQVMVESGSATTLTIEIRDMTDASTGNDFALDGISMRASSCTP